MALLPASDQPDEVTSYELYLNQLKSRHEDVESLLSGGTDVDELITAGVLDIEEEGWGWQVIEEVPDLDETETANLISRLSQHWGLDLEGYSNAPNPPH